MKEREREKIQSRTEKKMRGELEKWEERSDEERKKDEDEMCEKNMKNGRMLSENGRKKDGNNSVREGEKNVSKSF